MNWPLHNSGQLLAHASTLPQSANPTVCLSDCRSADPLSSVQSITSSFGIFEEKYLTLLVAIVFVLASFFRFTKAGSFEDYDLKYESQIVFFSWLGEQSPLLKRLAAADVAGFVVQFDCLLFIW